MTTGDLERLRAPALVLTICGGLLVGLDLFVLLLNALGLDVSVFNQASTVRRLGRTQRTVGLGLSGPPLIVANTALLLSHALLLGLAAKLWMTPTRGLALAAALWALVPCNGACCLFPISIWLFVATRNRASS